MPVQQLRPDDMAGDAPAVADNLPTLLPKYVETHAD